MKETNSSSVSELYDLTNNVALVTGATGQLGQTICEALAEQGAHIVVNSRTETDCTELADKISSKYQKSIGIAGDVTEEAEVQDIISSVKDEFGRLDILVNNAYSGEVAPFEEMSAEQFRTALDGALVSTFLCTRESLPLLQESKGSVINIASIYGIVAPDHSIYGDSALNNPINYGAAKAGVIQLTRWVATRYGKTGIRANVITPGGFYDTGLETRTDYTDEFVPNYEERTPLCRMGDPEDMKGPITFLASDASQWMTGQNLVVDGGWTVW